MPKPYDDGFVKALTPTVLDRSYELRQLDALISASKLGQADRFFEWLDPAGNRDGGLGINMLTYIPIGKAQTQELMDERGKVESNLIETTANDVEKANQFILAYSLAKSGLEIQNRRVARHLGNLRSGIDFSMSDLTDALRQRMNAEIQMLQDQYGYLVIQGALNRLSLAGPYAWLPSETWGDSNEWVHPGRL